MKGLPGFSLAIMGLLLAGGLLALAGPVLALGLGRIEVANAPMVAICRMFELDLDGIGQRIQRVGSVGRGARQHRLPQRQRHRGSQCCQRCPRQPARRTTAMHLGGQPPRQRGERQHRIGFVPMAQVAIDLDHAIAQPPRQAPQVVQPRDGAQPAAVKIGVLHPVTGALAFSGQQCREGALMAIEDINKAGGIKSLYYCRSKSIQRAGFAGGVEAVIEVRRCDRPRSPRRGHGGRDGGYIVDTEGVMRTRSGLAIQGEGGQIVVPPGSRITLGIDGTVSAAASVGADRTVQVLGRIKLVNPAERAVYKGDSPGDLSSLVNPETVAELQGKLAKA